MIITVTNYCAVLLLLTEVQATVCEESVRLLFIIIIFVLLLLRLYNICETDTKVVRNRLISKMAWQC